MQKLKVYLAGKIKKGSDDWRSALFGGKARFLAQTDHYEEPYWPDEVGITEDVVCVGPWFISCDHGCFHGPSTHGQGAGGGGCGFAGGRQEEVLDRCLAAINRADVVFAWFDEPGAYGTTFELGYARAKGKRLYAGVAPAVKRWTPESLTALRDECRRGGPTPLEAFAESPPARDEWLAISACRRLGGSTPLEAFAHMLEIERPGLLLASVESPIERKLAQALLSRGVHSFIPQYLWQGYRMDFAFPSSKVCVETDGHDYHSTKEQQQHDRERDRVMQMAGWMVLRFTGSEVHAGADRCARVVAEALSARGKL